MLKCPNCGAPLQGANLAEQHACTYCGALLQVPQSAPPRGLPLPVPTAPAAPQAPRMVLVISVLMLLGVALAAGVATFRGMLTSMSSPPAPPTGAPRAGSEPASPKKPAGIAWSRLEAVDIHTTTDQAKVVVRQQFPEAKVEQDKDYHLDLDHPILSEAWYPWDWGCACLERVVFYFKDYPTRMKTQEAFIPCLVRGLGPLTTSAPPFDYEWAAHGDTPRVHLGPQTLTISLEHTTSEASYRNVLRVLGACRN